MPAPKVALLTAGGLAPCLSSAVAALIERYGEIAPNVEIIGYRSGYKGLLQGQSLQATPEVRARIGVLHRHGGSPIGNSRVKLTNVADCVKRGLVKEGQDPLQVAAEQLTRDRITILHTIGGDDTSTTAAELAKYLRDNGAELTVVGLPKTVDNDIVPVRQSLGALTAAEQGAIFFENIVNEASASPRNLLIHEVMGRNCGWLTAATANVYRERLNELEFLPEFNLGRAHKEIDAVYIPEIAIDIEAEGERLRRLMDEKDCVNVFLSEGASAGRIVEEKLAAGETLERDAFGHVKLDKVNVGDWFGKRFAKLVGAERTLVQKSGYFARAAAANAEDLRLIRQMAEVAAACGLDGEPGLIGHDEGRSGELRAIELPRVKGGKPFDIGAAWFAGMLETIGQPVGGRIEAKHGEAG
ncbi:MAG: pyrophosphate--fructose-6-phosphate 1-phosphotransferase [Rhizobiales bacterium]|nr:pyrophosphate--fructose-6-phosphate 1-phosphotransferase [Hyphomicrobiales bacterium]MDQ3559392.1 pyrophosphate--fructose-6-phosphate 1-phosphotransferase [Pseudomonadota bacterium]